MPIAVAILLVTMMCLIQVRNFLKEPSGSTDVDQSAQRTRSGWKSNRIARARSESNPKASIPLTNCEMLPGKIAKKKSAVAMPTSRRRLSEIRQRPSAISTIPDAMTTKSGESGSQVGTCAWNSIRLVVKCRVPV